MNRPRGRGTVGSVSPALNGSEGEVVVLFDARRGWLWR